MRLTVAFLGFAVVVSSLRGQETSQNGVRLLGEASLKLFDLLDPGAGEAITIGADLKITSVTGWPEEMKGQTVSLALRAPDRLKVSLSFEGRDITICRAGQSAWIYAPNEHFGIDGSPDVPRFSNDPASTESTTLAPLRLPLERQQLALMPALVAAQQQKDEVIRGERCHVLRVEATRNAREALGLPAGEVMLALREADLVPARIGFRVSGSEIIADVLRAGKLSITDDFWKLPAKKGDRIETVALAHVEKFISNFFATLTNTVPPLGPATGERKVVATEGDGRLEWHDGTRVLFLEGTPEDMGRQHGTLLEKEIRQVTDRILYGVGVGSSFAKGRWFFGEIEEAQKRLQKFMDARYVREMDALAVAAGLHQQEVRLANFFPELFHCSGFALHGTATADGEMYHGRVLDYLKGMGLEQNAVVMVVDPDQGHAWVNCGYAGFVGSITAMNERHIAIGEMGGRGEGNWDGKPMAQLMREVMEKAATIDEAVAILRAGPRTCEYYYVISDANSMRACGIAATPQKFEVIWSGESHPQLPHAVKDAVLMSAGDRYEELARRVRAGLGKFSSESARALMTRPVCMNSNIQSVLFAPRTLDFWVANADGKNVASHTRFTRYNLRELLNSTAPAAEPEE